MLKIEATRDEKRPLLYFMSSLLMSGFVLMLELIRALQRPVADEGYYALVLMLTLTFLTSAILSMWMAVRGWYHGRIHTRVFITRRTLAIVPRGSRALFIKREDVVAAAGGGGTLVMADGTRHCVDDLGNFVAATARERLLVRLYDYWWPDCHLARVQRYLRENQPPSTLVSLLFLGFPLHLLGIALSGTYWGAWGALAYFAIMVIAVIAAFRSFSRKCKTLEFRFDGPEAQDDYTGPPELRHAQD